MAAAEGLELQPSSNQTGFAGVYINTSNNIKPFEARVRRNGKRVSLGHFSTPEAASLYVARAAAEDRAAEEERKRTGAPGPAPKRQRKNAVGAPPRTTPAATAAVMTTSMPTPMPTPGLPPPMVETIIEAAAVEIVQPLQSHPRNWRWPHGKLDRAPQVVPAHPFWHVTGGGGGEGSEAPAAPASAEGRRGFERRRRRHGWQNGGAQTV